MAPTKLEIALVHKLGGSVILTNDDFIAADRLKVDRVVGKDGTVTLRAHKPGDARFAVVEGTCSRVRPSSPMAEDPVQARRDFFERDAANIVGCPGCGSRVSSNHICRFCGEDIPDYYGGL